MDKEYWKRIYQKQNEETLPSLFARSVAERLDVAGKRIIELGCGNGRDAIHFANHDAIVTAIDQCDNMIETLQYRFQRVETLQFECCDFTMLADGEPYDLVFSRFTLHSISEEQETNVLNWTIRNLKPGGHLCIEARGQKNEIYRIGHPVKDEPDAFILDGHYRRFINFNSFCKKLELIGFNIEYAAEQKGFAPFNGDDETYMRIVASK